MAGAAGFEPANAEIKTQCLAAWRRPSDGTQVVPRDGGDRLFASNRLPVLFKSNALSPTERYFTHYAVVVKHCLKNL